MKLIVICFLIINVTAWAQKRLSQEEAEQEILDYTNIRSVLKNDGLEKEKKKKEKILKAIVKEKKQIEVDRFRYPTEEDFWLMASEFWLVKKAQLLRWDFPKPDYGIDVAFKNLLENYGFFNKTFKILMINSPAMTHMGLPAGGNKYIFVLSLPFIKAMDLTKVDISLILFEDMLRLEAGLFKSNLSFPTSFLGTSFYGKKIDTTLLTSITEKYDNLIFNEGFNFKQQYEMTKKMDQYLKADPALWNAYYNLLKKIDRLIKMDNLYEKYLKIYPSPELQMQWISPSKKVI